MKNMNYTENALQGNRVASMFRAAFAAKKVGDSSVDISEPEQSTNKGVLALQHITIKRPNGLGLVVGSVNAVKREGVLRPFATVARAYEKRFKLAPDFDDAGYAEFVKDATALLEEQGIVVTVGAVDTGEVDDAAGPGAGAAVAAVGSGGGATPGSRNAVFIALGIGLAVGAALMWLMR